ncbi:hypothetical protein HanPI659440_Chr16g0640131 [Helianthus annuus]|nr:hypothetical protein HanPI659440_Chr16g0640131 [Helianthus annuus]
MLILLTDMTLEERAGVVGALKVGNDVVELGEVANVKYEGVEAAGGRAEDWKAAGRRMMF